KGSSMSSGNRKGGVEFDQLDHSLTEDKIILAMKSSGNDIEVAAQKLDVDVKKLRQKIKDNSTLRSIYMRASTSAKHVTVSPELQADRTKLNLPKEFIEAEKQGEAIVTRAEMAAAISEGVTTADELRKMLAASGISDEAKKMLTEAG